ncbi:Leucine rich repeat protein, partial [Spraguea lophii 42_110]
MNSFEEIPFELYSFANLKILNIFSNRIEKVIIEDGMFNNLLELYLGYNKISEISISDNALQSLATFDLSCNNFQNLNKNILKTIKKLKKCIIIDNIFTEIERYIYEGDYLINLTLILKDISVLPNIFEFNCIHELIVECKGQSNNEIDIFEYVPINSKIKHLNLSHCFLISISSGISKLINLETFNAINNKIIILDNVFTDMNSLKLLDLSFNQIANIDRNIFDIVTLEELKLAFNYIELLPSNINNMSNRNLQIDLCRNPLYLGIDVNLFYPELITIEQISDDLLRNIRYDRIRTSQETDTEIRRKYINMDLNVKIYYEELNIPTDERLNLEEIKSCQIVKPGNHRKTKEEIKKISQDIFTQIDT